MPELPEVETIKRSLERHLVGARITAVKATVDKLRIPINRGELQAFCLGQRIHGLRRRAKFLIVAFESGKGLILHLGMTGAFRIVPADEPLAPHDRVTWELADGRSWRFVDARRFGSVQMCDLPGNDCDPEPLGHLGPEPLDSAFDAAYLYGITRGRARPIKTLIMDQAIVVGVGNIYASEALFRAGISPKRRSGRVGRGATERLVCAIKEVLCDAIAQGGTTISDFRNVDGTEGHFRIHLAVYGRPGGDCKRCGLSQGIRREVQAGRSSFFCPRCQR